MLSTLQLRWRLATPFFAFHLMGSTRPRFRQSSPAIARRCNFLQFSNFDRFIIVSILTGDRSPVQPPRYTILAHRLRFNPHRRSLAGATYATHSLHQVDNRFNPHRRSLAGATVLLD